mmetsp:Transcript_1245/g.2838  ORF Transcript_1245/g.2838 Transcript_1245/m.2838 type:complete len:204 (+) Transcript_1245:208-819(+)
MKSTPPALRPPLPAPLGPFFTLPSPSLAPFSSFATFSLSSSFFCSSFFFLTIFRRVKSSLSSSSSSLLMYEMVSAMRGSVTFSRAFTRLLVTFSASSMATKEVCSEAIFTSARRYSENLSRHAPILRPPATRPRFSLPSAPVSYWLKTGSFTPATLSVREVTRTEALMLFTKTLLRKVPAAYSACVRLKNDSDACSAMPCFVA